MTRIAMQEVLPRVGMTRIGKQGVMARVGRTRIVMHGRLPRGKSALDRELAIVLDIHAASGVYKDAVDPAIGNLNCDHHWIVMGLYRVVGIILSENNLSRPWVFPRSSGYPKHILASDEL
ncbi:hypothetical protein LWI29_026444 [Acer saccharum]|uniref:Uncharacterized protein n=1 Tax=Acer saccharum TaxID=4024 RepID=A0AA39W6G1_ACESA|nr:hypothetical protein LWI29_026444 [Acer saccharum]